MTGTETGGTRPLRILFVFARLADGGEETEVCLLARGLDPARFRIDVVACFRKPGMPEQTHDRLLAAGVRVDTTPYGLDFDGTVAYLASIVPGYDVVVSYQNVADIYPAFERLHLRPPLIERGTLVADALGGPKHFTSRYVGAYDKVRDAAAGRMFGRELHALAIPWMVDLGEFPNTARDSARAALGIAEDRIVAGWVGQLDSSKRVEDFIDAATIAGQARANLDFLIIGSSDVFLPSYADHLKDRARKAGLAHRLRFFGGQAPIPEVLPALDVFCWLSRRGGTPHLIAEAGAAGLPVIAIPDDGALEQIEDGVTGLFVPQEDTSSVAAAMLSLADDPALRKRLGTALRQKVERDYAARVVIPQWERLLIAVARERQLPTATGLFATPLLAGFECSSHRRHIDGARRDMIALTRHDIHAADDYRLVKSLGMSAVRDGLRWHLIEQDEGSFDWSSADTQIEAAAVTGTPVIWDLLHYGTPDWLDVWSAEFTDRFVAFALAAADRIAKQTGMPLYLCPVNEISFFSWGGGEVGYLNPFARGRGQELKVQLARAAIAATRAIRSRHPAARFITAEPLINIVAHSARPHQVALAEGHRHAQFQAFDMLTGRSWPQLGGADDILDIVGVNFYHNNQWLLEGETLDWRDPARRPLSSLLAEVYGRYGKPIMIAETGIEGDDREEWIAYVAEETASAIALGVPVEGICLYPVMGHIGWDDERYCPNGPIDLAADGSRVVHPPSEAALRLAAMKIEQVRRRR